MITSLVVLGFLLAALAAGQFSRNLSFFVIGASPLADASSWVDVAPLIDGLADVDGVPEVSVLIPARDEEAGIETSICAALAQESVVVEVVVLDDHSSDRTAEIVKRLEAEDSRVRYALGQTLPDGWNGKQHACLQLARLAEYENLLFLDADVRLQPSGLRRLLAYRKVNQVGLLSAFPRQETVTWLEQWLIPMMHYILLCYLPFDRMRSSTSPAYASGCGQLFLTDQISYQNAGTHEAIASSRHDGLKLPKAYRFAGLSTDVIDGTHVATCRMYRNANEVIRGGLKNATEGIANLKLILPFTVLLLGGSVLPVAMALVCFLESRGIGFFFSFVAIALGHAPRVIGAIRFRQPLAGTIAHAPSVAVFIVLQWVALIQAALGFQVQWRGRS